LYTVVPVPEQVVAGLRRSLELGRLWVQASGGGLVAALNPGLRIPGRLGIGQIDAVLPHAGRELQELLLLGLRGGRRFSNLRLKGFARIARPLDGRLVGLGVA
jgi:hypothetical protein